MSLGYAVNRLSTLTQRIREYIDRNIETWANEELKIFTDIGTQKGVHPNLLAAIKVEKADFMAINFVWDYPKDGKPIEIFIEYGTKPHIIKARLKKYLRFKIGDIIFFRKQVRHPGIKAANLIGETMPKFIENLKKRTEDETTRYLEQESI